MTRTWQRRLAWAGLIAASGAALSFVPASPFLHLDDPSYWGVLGYVAVVALLLVRDRSGWRAGSPNRATVRAFLVGLPVVYVANGVRFGGTPAALAIEAGGLIAWWAAALLSVRIPGLLAWGSVAHAAWDLGHLGRAGFVPDWYVMACIFADVGLGIFVLWALRSDAACPGGSTGGA